MTSIALLGCGHLGACLLKGLLSAGHSPRHLHIIDRRAQHRDHLQRDYPQLSLAASPSAALRNSATVLLCVKPQELRAACQQAMPYLQDGSGLISTAAGIRCSTLQSWTDNKFHVIRCMPNIAAAVGHSMSVLYSAGSANHGQEETATAIFNAVGQTEWIQEEQDMDLVTALSGSGPAYFFRFIEALVQAAQAQGMPEKLAHRLSVQTAIGASLYLQKSKHSAAQARQQVTSAGGTTEQAIAVLEKNNLDAAIAAAIKVAQARAREISDGFEQE